jgi:hypothetical protein
VEVIGCGRSGDGVREFGWVDGGGAGQAFAGTLLMLSSGPVKPRYFDVFDDGAFDVHFLDSFFASVAIGN